MFASSFAVVFDEEATYGLSTIIFSKPLQKNSKIETTKVVTKWSQERYSDHSVTTTCSLRKSRHKEKSVTKWSQSATIRNVVFELSNHNNVDPDNDHNNVDTNNDHNNVITDKDLNNVVINNNHNNVLTDNDHSNVVTDKSSNDHH